MTTRSHQHEEQFSASPQALFELLLTPSAIREWWSASAAIVVPRIGGCWAARWGEEDDPDYLTAATIEVFEPPRRMVLADYQYVAKQGGLPFEADFNTEFVVEAAADGARLRVTQHGFPAGPEADEYLAACKQGWTDTFAGIRRYLDAEGEA